MTSNCQQTKGESKLFLTFSTYSAILGTTIFEELYAFRLVMYFKTSEILAPASYILKKWAKWCWSFHKNSFSFGRTALQENAHIS